MESNTEQPAGKSSAWFDGWDRYALPHLQIYRYSHHCDRIEAAPDDHARGDLCIACRCFFYRSVQHSGGTLAAVLMPYLRYQYAEGHPGLLGGRLPQLLATRAGR